MVREFRLVNEKGQEYSLMDIENYCLLTDPSGLGYSYNTEYEQIDEMFFTNLRKLAQGQINGTINCLYYDNYKALIDFIESSDKLKFACKIPYKSGQKEYFKDVNIQSIEKTQIQTTGTISEPVVFDCLSLWYEENTTVYTIQPVENEIRWDFRWDSRFTDYTSRNLQFINRGHIEAPISVEFDGKVINPKIQLYVEGSLYQELKFNITINEYEKLLYCTRRNEFYIKKENTDGTQEDLYDLDILQDFANINEVIRIPKNKSCELRLTADNNVLNAKTTIWIYYKAV